MESTEERERELEGNNELEKERYTGEDSAARTEVRFIVSKQKLFEAGTCFGHPFRFWNPKMRKYLFANVGRLADNHSRSGGNIHLISLAKTQEALDLAYRLVSNLTKQGVRFLFVGTKPQAKKAIEEQAVRTGSPFVNER